MNPGPGDPGPGDRFGLLLLVLVACYVMSAFLASAWVSAVQIVLFVVVAGLAVRTGRIPRNTDRLVCFVLLAGSLAAVALALTVSTGAGAGVVSLWAALMLVFAVVVIVRRVLSHQVITLQSIFGAVSAYIIIGLMFAALYGAGNRFGGGGFFAHAGPANIKTFQYFSFTTLTTLGYGDFTAAGSGGRAVAVMEALMGQVFLATLVARLVAAFRPGTRTSEDGPASTRRRSPGALGGRRAARPARQQPRRQPHRDRRRNLSS